MTNSPSTDSPSDHPNVLVLPPVIYGVGLAAGFLLQWVAPRATLSSGTRYWAGGVLLTLGVCLAVWGRRVMERAGTNVNPTLPTTALVATGPFRLSRNPLYVGLALVANVLWVLVLVAPVLLVMHYGVVRREERYLEAKFGDAYRQYRSRVRRYF